ncbi:MAG: hypothetical protein GJ678_09900 [Rhodobacteraceae bacterium]|nr:hypothetical protein [Paracoccaceae bacterium]
MKPGFALSLSSDGITYLHRAAGGWRNIGMVTLDHSDLKGALEALRKKGDALELSEPDCCKLVIPNDQIRYLTIETGMADPRERRALAAEALEGATPYAVTDLAFDISEDGTRTHIAAVAREPLAEAEGFAVDHGFTPACFVAIPGDMDFLGEPFFGPAKAIGESPIEPDGIAVVDVGPAEQPKAKIPPAPAPSTRKTEPEAKPAEKPAPQKGTTDQPAEDRTEREPARPKGGLTLSADTATASLGTEETLDVGPAEDITPALGFSTRRRRGEASKTPSPALAGASRTPPAAGADTGLSARKEKEQPDSQAPKTSPPLKTQEEILAKDLAAAALASPIPAAPPLTSGGPAKPSSKDEKSVSTLAAATSGISRFFANSKPQRTAEKPRNMGLILTVLLLIFMLAVAALAYVTGTGPFARFSDTQEVTEGLEAEPTATPPAQDVPDEAITVPEPDQQPVSERPAPSDSAPVGEATPAPLALIDPDTRPIAPQVSPIPDQPDPGVIALPEEPAAPDEADTELARLDDPASETAIDPEAIADGIADEPETEPAQLSAMEQAAQYAATGIWQAGPQIAEVPAVVDLDNIYVASIDHTNLSQDAVALPPQPDLQLDDAPDVVSSPAAAGSSIALDQRGLVEATPEGTVNPDGVMVYLGRPPVVPPPTPPREDPDAEAAAAAAEAEAARLETLSRLRPRARPANLTEQVERSQLGGRSRAELASLRPRARPATLKTDEEETQPATEQAVSTSLNPRQRPANFANIVDRAQRSTTPAATAAAAPAASITPRIPSSASVSRQATITNAINLRKLNLIGVYGTAADRRALVRLPSGRYRKVQVGDRLDGGRVVAIGEAQLQYQKSGRNETLKIPD